MNDFCLCILKGLYPVYFFLMIVGIIHRVRKGKWSGFDTLLLLAFFIFECLAALQVFFFYGMLVTSSRYLWVGLVLCLPIAAEGLLASMASWTAKKFRKTIAACLVAIVIIVNLFNAYSHLYQKLSSPKKRQKKALANEIAAWIENDWKKHGRHCGPIAVFKCDQYQSGKRPLVKSELVQVGWLCGGQNYPIFLAEENIMPDYIISRDVAIPTGYALAGEVAPMKIYESKSMTP